MTNDLKFIDLRLLPGAKLDLRSEQFSSIKGGCKYIGFDGRYIIVSTPLVKGRPIQCKPDMEVILRFFVNHLNCVCAFRTKIILVSNHPSSVLMLELPETMEIGEVRSSVRANVSLLCKINFHQDFRPPNQPGELVNLSVDGAKLIADNFIGDEEEKITISITITVLDLEKRMSINGVIRSSSMEDGKFSYGIQLIDVDHTSKLLIYAYVLSHMK